ncbi:hypothetical protein VCCP104417_1259, partial [Vibrio cholerae CP1044(17)]
MRLPIWCAFGAQG